MKITGVSFHFFSVLHPEAEGDLITDMSVQFPI